MRRGRPGLAAALLLLAAGASGCATLGPPDDDWFGRDKAKHFVVCVAAGAAAAAAAGESGARDAPAFGIGLGFAAALGAGKETYDLRVKKTYWSWKDFTWDLLGGAVGASLAVSAR